MPGTPPGLRRRTFIASTAAAASGCTAIGSGTRRPEIDRYFTELEGALDRLHYMTPFTRTAQKGEDPGDLNSADESLQRTLHTLIVSGTVLDLEPEQRTDPRVQALLDDARENTNRACIEGLWAAEDVLEDSEDDFLERLDADPSEVLAAVEMLDRVAERAGLPNRWRRRLHKHTEEVAWRIQRQSARAVVTEAVEQSHKLLARADAAKNDPLAAALGLDGKVMDHAYASLDLTRLAPADPAKRQVQRPTTPSAPAPATSTPTPPAPAPTPTPASAPAPAPPTLPAQSGVAGAAPASASHTEQPPTTAAPVAEMPPPAPPVYTPPSPPQVVSDDEDPLRGTRSGSRRGELSIRIIDKYAGYRVTVLTTMGEFTGVVAGTGTRRLILLQNAFRRIKIPLSAAKSFTVLGPHPEVLRAARASAVGMTIAGAIMIPIGIIGTPFTLGISLFLTCPGIALLIIGIIRLRQTRRGYRSELGKAS